MLIYASKCDLQNACSLVLVVNKFLFGRLGLWTYSLQLSTQFSAPCCSTSTVHSTSTSLSVYLLWWCRVGSGSIIKSYKAEVMWSFFVHLSVILSRITDKVMSWFHSNLVLWLDLPIRLTMVEQRILGDLLAFLIQSPPDFYKTWQNDWRQQDNHSTTFWERSRKHPDPD